MKCKECNRELEVWFFENKGRHSDGAVKHKKTCKICDGGNINVKNEDMRKLLDELERFKNVVNAGVESDRPFSIKKRLFTKEQEQEIFESRESGSSWNELADQYKANKSTIRNIVKRLSK